jgi:hypothetical protein
MCTLLRGVLAMAFAGLGVMAGCGPQDDKPAAPAGLAGSPPAPSVPVPSSVVPTPISPAAPIVEYYGIASNGAPWSSHACEAGAANQQAVLNAHAKEGEKWFWACHRRDVTTRLTMINAITALTGEELVNWQSIELNMCGAFSDELTESEQTALAEFEASRPDSEFDRLVEEAYQWAQGLERTKPEDRVLWQKQQLERSPVDLRGEIRRRYVRTVR